MKAAHLLNSYEISFRGLIIGLPLVALACNNGTAAVHSRLVPCIVYAEHLRDMHIY